MKILVLGHRGMAGHIILKYLKEKGHLLFDADTLLNQKFNALTDLCTLKSRLRNEKVDYIINCIGLLVKKCEEDPSLAIKTNSLFPHELANMCSDLGIKLIHLSTDCYLDDNIYGRSKRAGEVYYGKNLTIRTSIIGPEVKKDGVGLFEWFMKQKGEINGYSRVMWDGVTTLELAKFIHWSLDQKEAIGIKNLRHPNPISKYDLLSIIKKVYNKNVKINKFEDICENKSEKSDFPDYPIPTYEEMILQIKDYTNNHI